MLPRREFLASTIGALTLALFPAQVFSQQGATKPCVIASSDGRGNYRTDEITNCSINILTGDSKYIYKGQSRQRSNAQVRPLTTRHLRTVEYWSKRVRQLKFDPATNPAGFDIAAFLEAASKSRSGYVLVRDRNGKVALNLVFISDGVMRSIDLPGTNLREKPLGFLTTAMQ